MKTISYKDILKLKQYRKLLIADVVSRFGDSIDAIAFSWLAYTLSGDAKWSAIVFTINLLPTVLFQPFAGVIVERLKKRNIMIAADLIRFILVILCFSLLTLQLLNIWILMAITFLNSTVEAFRMPASTAFIPELVEPEQYEVTTSLSSSSSRLMELLGSGASGIIIAVLGIPFAMLIDATTFLISAFTLSLIKSKPSIVKEEKKEPSKYSEDLKSGFTYIYQHKLFLLIALLAVVTNFLLTPVFALQSPYVAEVLHGQSDYLSYISIATSLGMLVGSFIYPKLSKRFSFQALVIAPLATVGTYFFGMALLGNIYTNVILTIALLVLLNFTFGFGGGIINTAIMVKFMNVIDPKFLARVTACFVAASALAAPISSTLSSIMVSYLSISSVFMIYGVAILIIMALTGRLLYRAIIKLNKEYSEPPLSKEIPITIEALELPVE